MMAGAQGLVLAACLLWSQAWLFGAGVTVRFDPASVEVGPFPTDYLTVADPVQKTGRRVNLPSPPIAEINLLDGFNLQPRIRVRFSSAINPHTLREGIYFVALENLTDEEYGLQRPGQVTPINQVIYDPATETAYAKPDAFLDQHRRHALVVTDAVRDRAGNAVGADAAFSKCLQESDAGTYCGSLAETVRKLAPVFAPRRIVAASVFTTLSATAWMEKARAAIQNTPLSVRPAAQRSVFEADKILGFTLERQVGVNPARFDEFTAVLPAFVLESVGKIAFLRLTSPSFLNERGVIPPRPTGAEVPPPPAASPIDFHVFLPASPKPAAGYPVVIFGHGLNDSRFGGPTLVAGSLARAGFAVAAMNAAGHGNGPEGRFVITEANLRKSEVPAGGRGWDLNGDGTIGSSEGCLLVGAPPVVLRDCLRQTALDLMQLARALRAGVDADGDGTVDLDGNRICYAGQSLGALYGTLLHAIEPEVRAAVLNVGGATVVDVARWSPGFQMEARGFLAAANPALLNRGSGFDENYVLRYRPVKINDVAGAIEIQNYFEMAEWFQAAGDPAAYAPHLKSSTLPGVPIKPTLFQVAKGDRTVPNPASTHLVRAANMREHTLFYRHDLARAVAKDLSENPHTYLVDISSAGALLVALKAQQQVAEFLGSDGAAVPSPSDPLVRLLFGRDLFEVPGFLTEDLNF